METHVEQLASIEDVDRYWHLPLPVLEEEPLGDLGALRLAEKRRRRQRQFRRAQQATAAAVSCAVSR